MYFDCLPSDLLPPLLSYNSSTELYQLLPHLINIKIFQKLLTFENDIWSRIFWENVWRRDVSSFMELPDNPYETYMEIFKDLHSKRLNYFAVKGYDILCYSMVNNEDTYAHVMIPAIKYNYKSMIYKLLENPIWSLDKHYNQIMRIAAVNGHLDLVTWAMKRSSNPNKYNKIMLYAALGGHVKIIALMIACGATDYNILHMAALGGHMNIIQLMLQLGATNYDSGMEAAAEEGHCEIIEKMLELGATNYTGSLDGAARYGHNDAIKLILNHATIKNISLDLTKPLQKATKWNHIETVKLLLSHKSQTNAVLNNLLYLATRFNHKDLVKLFLNHGANDFIKARTIANNKGYAEIVNLVDQYRKLKEVN